MDPSTVNGISTDFTSTIHREPYPAISPIKPSLSQAGKTVLITGGGTGIGKAIAHNFILASAATVIIIGRRVAKLQEAAAELEAAGKQSGKTVSVITKGCDVTSDLQVEALWADLADSGVHVDVLVLNAAVQPPAQTLFELGTAAVWSFFEAHVKGPLYFAELFYKQHNSSDGPKQKFLINVSSAAIHFRGNPIVDMRPAYSLTKSSGTLAIQMLADRIPAEDMQILNFHPGMVYGAVFEADGIPEDALPFDDGKFVYYTGTEES